MTCQTHNKQIEGVCESCKSFVCFSCTTSDHRGHAISSYDEAESRARRKLGRLLKIHERDLSHLNQNRDLLEQAENAEDKIESIIQNRRDELKTELVLTLDKTSKKLIDSCKKDERKRLSFLNEQKTLTDADISDKNGIIKKLNRILQVGKKDALIRQGFEFKEEDNHTPVDLLTVQALEFTPGLTGDTDVEEMFGQVNNTTPGNESVQGTSVPLNSMTCSISPADDNASDFDETTPQTPNNEAEEYTEWNGRSFNLSRTREPLHSICLDSTGYAWMKCNGNLQRMDKDGKVNENTNFTNCITGMALDESKGRILITNRYNRNIEQLSLLDFSKTLFKNCIQIPLHICMAGDGNILVTLVDNKVPTVTEDSTRSLVKLKDDGMVMNISRLDEFLDPLFVIPERVRTNNSGTIIAVVNRTNNSSSTAGKGAVMGGHLVILDGNLKLKYRYLGDENVVPATSKYNASTSDTKFVPSDVDFDLYDNIILVDCYTKSVQLRRSTDCSLIRYLLSDTSVPLSVAYNRHDVTFWVGFKDGKLTIIQIMK